MIGKAEHSRSQRTPWPPALPMTCQGILTMLSAVRQKRLASLAISPSATGVPESIALFVSHPYLTNGVAN